MTNVLHEVKCRVCRKHMGYISSHSTIFCPSCCVWNSPEDVEGAGEIASLKKRKTPFRGSAARSNRREQRATPGIKPSGGAGSSA